MEKGVHNFLYMDGIALNQIYPGWFSGSDRMMVFDRY
jgi:hypothetical protein